MNYIVIRQWDEMRRVHISEIAVLMLESTAISITAYAMNELIQHKVKVIFCDEKRNPSAEVLPCHGSCDTSARIRSQIRWKDETKQRVWTEIIRKKIEGQRDVLKKLKLSQANMLDGYLSELAFNDDTNREGHAAKVYFNALFGNEFSRDFPCPVNAALDYGYSLILSVINREIVASGYLTQIGIHHDNTFNAFNLGCDFMEPLRPMIDNAVLQMDPEDFGKEQKRELILLLNSTVFFSGRKQVLLYAIRLYCAGLFRTLEDNRPDRIDWIHYEL